MKDDVSDIPTTGCSVLTSGDTLSNYTGRTKSDYVFSGGKWIHYRDQYSNYNDYDVSNYNCIDVTELNTYAIYTPFIYGMGFVLFGFTLFLFVITIKGFLYGIK